MGSKTEYYTDLQVNHMFDELDNLWGQEINRAVSSVGSMNPRDVFPAIVNDSMFFYNETIFNKMGVNANVHMSVARLTKSGIGYYISTNIDPQIQEVNTWYYTDSNGVPVESSILQVKDGLNDWYGFLGQCTVDVWQELNGHIFTEQYLSYKIDDVPHVIRTRDYADKSIPDTQFVSDKYGVWMVPVDENCVKDFNNPIHVPIPTDDRAVIAVEYVRTNSTNKFIFLYESDITSSAEIEETMVLPFYKNFNMTETDDNMDYILMRFGIGAPDKDGYTMKESMRMAAGNQDLKHSFITYSLDRNDERFGHWVDFIYGAPDGDGDDTPTSVSVTGEYNIDYRMKSSAFNTGYTVTVEHESKDANEGYYYIMPTRFLKKQTLPNKFNAYKYMFNMWAYAEKEVEIKWYQTMLFRIIFFIIGLVAGVALGFISVAQAITMAAMQAVSIVLSQLDPRLAAIIGLVFAVVAFNPGSISSILNVANNMLRAFSAYSQHVFQASLDAISTEIEDLNEETKDLKQELADMWHQGMYVPLDSQDYMMSTMYNCGEEYMEMAYNQSDMMEIAMENMLNPNARLV